MPRETVYEGPYVDAAPDVVVGYNHGYRVSWESAIGKCAAEVFADNRKAWSGDHCIHHSLVPGVLFSNLRLEKPDADITDLAPTTLDLLGVEEAAYMDGSSLLCVE
jgi:predicted AlkP superfamily phosphohydrolase/phosphomutase